MSVEIHPRKIRGKWADGYALDLHTTSSTFLGYDGYGHPQFETVRSELGELLYKLKYRADPSAVDSIAETAAEFLAEVACQCWPDRAGAAFQHRAKAATGAGSRDGDQRTDWNRTLSRRPCESQTNAAA